MTRKSLALLVLLSVTIAGCSGVQSPGTPTAEPTDVSPDEIPGVSNETLTNATALVAANGAGIAAEGATIRVTQTAPDGERRLDLTMAADGTAEFSRTMSADGNESTAAYYINDTATYVRANMDGETSYRVIERPLRPFEGVNSSLESVLTAGNFTVANASTESATVVLTADEFSLPPDVLGDATPQDARLVVTQDGRIQNLTLSGERDGEAVTYTYEQRQAAVDHAAAPDWLADVPPTADLQADLSTDIVNDSALRIDHEGGDTVPRNTTLRFTANDTAGTVTFDAPLEAGDTRTPTSRRLTAHSC